MTVDDEVPSRAIIELPSWLWGGVPEQLLVQAELHGRRVSSGSNVWQVQTEEQYRHASPQLVAVQHLAGPCQQPSRFDLLSVRGGPSFAVRVDDTITRAQLADVRRRAEESTALPDLLYLWQMETAVSPPGELAANVAGIYAGLRQLGMEGNAAEKPFANASVHLVRRATAVNHRIHLVPVLLRIAHDERLQAGQVDHLEKLSAAGKTVFASSGGLLDGLALLDNYVGPLLGAMSPGIWGITSYRPEFGAVLFSFSRLLSGTSRGPAELLDFLPTKGATAATWTGARFEEPVFCHAVTWWVGQLNKLMGVLTDPAVFTDRAGVYVPAKHHQALLTVEQLLRRVGSIQSSHRDDHARRVLLFTVLDTLERLTGRPIEVLCTLTITERTLNDLRSRIPEQAAPLLLHAAERAVAALKQLQGGFFITPMAAAPSDAGAIAGLPVERAVARYVKVLRDATHGHGSNKANRVAETNALLAHHDGDIPHDLALLGYLYLLDLLARPHDLGKTLYRGGRV